MKKMTNKLRKANLCRKNESYINDIKTTKWLDYTSKIINDMEVIDNMSSWRGEHIEKYPKFKNDFEKVWQSFCDNVHEPHGVAELKKFKLTLELTDEALKQNRTLNKNCGTYAEYKEKSKKLILDLRNNLEAISFNSVAKKELEKVKNKFEEIEHTAKRNTTYFNNKPINILKKANCLKNNSFQMTI